jgi:hypothetical protein
MAIAPAGHDRSFEDSVDAVIGANGVTRTYGEGEAAVHALRGVSLDIERHRLTARGRGTEPRQPVKLRARLPASAIDTGSRAAVAAKVTKATARSAEPGALRRTGTPAREASPNAATALPAGSPPGYTIKAALQR